MIVYFDLHNLSMGKDRACAITWGLGLTHIDKGHHVMLFLKTKEERF